MQQDPGKRNFGSRTQKARCEVRKNMVCLCLRARQASMCKHFTPLPPHRTKQEHPAAPYMGFGQLKADLGLSAVCEALSLVPRPI